MAHFLEFRPNWRVDPCRNQNWGIGVFTKGGIPKRGGLILKGGSYPPAHIENRVISLKFTAIFSLLTSFSICLYVFLETTFITT